MGPDEGSEGEQEVSHADEAKVRREGERTDGSAAAESREAELPGAPSEARGCRGGARAIRSQSSKNSARAESSQRRKACQSAKTAEGELRTM